MNHLASDVFERFFAIALGERRRVESFVEVRGPQGASGSRVGYYEVVSRDPRGRRRTDRLVTKEAVQFERRVIALLLNQGCAVPPALVPDTESPGRATVVMRMLDGPPDAGRGVLHSPWTRSVARGLAGIHQRNLRAPRPWLPHVSDDVRGSLWLDARLDLWEAALRDDEFHAEFHSFGPAIEQGFERFLEVLAALSAEGGTLTLLNVDLHPGHILRDRNHEARFIDWEQAAYGPLYLDLANPFTVETALAYRAALSEGGVEIPAAEFLERFREVGRYMGLRYLGAALEDWLAGGARRERRRWFLQYTLTLALRGR